MSLGFIPSIMGNYQRLNKRMILFGSFIFKDHSGQVEVQLGGYLCTMVMVRRGGHLTEWEIEVI